MKTMLQSNFTAICFFLTLLYANVSSAGLIYSNSFDANNDPLGYGYQYYSIGHYAEEDYQGTGLSFADMLVLNLDVRSLPNSSSFNLDMLVNNNVVGSFNTMDLNIGLNELIFNFSEIESLSNDWMLTMQVSSDLCIGCGSLWLEQLHKFTLSSSTNSIPEPTSVSIFLLGLFALITRRLKTSQQHK